MANYQYGTLQLLDTLATIDKDNVFDYGEDRLYANIRDLLVVHNMLVRDMVGFFVGFTTDNIRRFGGQNVGGKMVEVDEFGAADVQKVAVTGYDVGFPLRKYQYAVGWTRAYFEVRTPADIAKDFVAARDADIDNIRIALLSALTRATNYTFVDRWANSQSLPVKALINADGTSVPIDRFGNTFDGSTHTHLLARAGGALAASDITAAIDTVIEHGVNGGQVVVLINRAQEATVAALAPFTPLLAPMLNPGGGSTDDVPVGPRDNPYEIDDKPIGVWDGFAMVWTKPWVPANYIIIALVGGQNDPILEMRTPAFRGLGNFRLVFDHEHYPLRAQHMERMFGFGVWNRLGAAILQTDDTTYAVPTIS